MSRQKKPRNKAYRQKPIYLPMTKATHDAEAIRLHAMAAALIQSPTADLFNATTRLLAAYSDAISNMRGGKPLKDFTDPAALAMTTAVLTMNAVCERHERTGKIHFSEHDAMSLRNACGIMDAEIARVPHNILQASKIIVEAWKPER